jgi:hypothetical protein
MCVCVRGWVRICSICARARITGFVEVHQLWKRTEHGDDLVMFQKPSHIQTTTAQTFFGQI